MESKIENKYRSKANKPDRWSAGAQMVYTIGIIKSAKSSKEQKNK